jgi:hypothetical protein
VRKKKNKRTNKRRPGHGHPPNPSPKIHVKVAVADTDLRGATRLVKPALLYADRVTIYSPAASMMNAAVSLGAVTDPRHQTQLLLAMLQEVPELATRLDLRHEAVSQLNSFLATDPRQMRRLAADRGTRDQIEQLYSHLDDIQSVWQNEFPDAIDKATDKLGGDELLIAVQAGAVKVADLTGTSATEIVAASVRSATGGSAGPPIDDLVLQFLTRIVEMLNEDRTFPLLDVGSSGLVRALEAEAALAPSPHALRHGAEVKSAASFMGYLPYFPELPMDEILDLRRSLTKPLVRLRRELGRMSREFESRPIDETFEVEVEDAWRGQVAPALADIREALAEHRLLSETASIALGDPRRLMAEAGGVLATAHAEVVSLSSLLTAGLAVGVPLADVAARALHESRQGKRRARQSAFYFLHQLGEEARSRS